MSVKSFLKNHGGDVAVVAGVGGFIATTVFAIKAAPKAKNAIENYELETNQKAKFKDKIKLTWKIWVPTAVVGVTSTASVIGGLIVKNKKASILTTALASAQASMATYQKAVVDRLGEDSEKELRLKALESNPNIKTQPLLAPVDEDGDVNCWDNFTQTPFKASMADLKMWVAEMNQRRLTGSFDEIYLTEYFDRFNIRESSAGSRLYWDLDHPVELDIDSVLIKGKAYISVTPKGYRMEV